MATAAAPADLLESAQAARRRRQRAAMRAGAGRLAEALRRVVELECHLAAVQAVGAEDPAEDELVTRLRLIAPVLRAQVADANGADRAASLADLVDILVASRRNAACHNFQVSGKEIRCMPQPALNRLQRRGKCGPRRARRFQFRADAAPFVPALAPGCWVPEVGADAASAVQADSGVTAPVGVMPAVAPLLSAGTIEERFWKVDLEARRLSVAAAREAAARGPAVPPREVPRGACPKETARAATWAEVAGKVPPLAAPVRVPAFAKARARGATCPPTRSLCPDGRGAALARAASLPSARGWQQVAGEWKPRQLPPAPLVVSNRYAELQPDAAAGDAALEVQAAADLTGGVTAAVLGEARQRTRRRRKATDKQAHACANDDEGDDATLTAAVADAAAAKRAMIAAGLALVPALQAALQKVGLRCPEGHALRCAAVWDPDVRCTRCAAKLAGAAAAGCDRCPAGDQVVFCAACVAGYKGGAAEDMKG